MVDVKKDGTGRGLPAAVEAAFAVLVEEDVDEEAEDATADIEIGNIFSDGALFLFGEGSGGSSKVQRGMIAVMKAWKSLEGLFLMMFEWRYRYLTVETIIEEYFDDTKYPSFERLVM